MSTEESTLEIVDLGDLRKYYASIPHLVDDLDLSPHAYRLYGHLKRVCGEAKDGKCYQNTDTLASFCRMSAGQVSKAKQELKEQRLIRIEKRKRPQGGKDMDVIFILDIWLQNFQKYAKASSHSEVDPQDGGASSHDELASSHGEQAISPHEIKKNPLKKNTLKKDSVAPVGATPPPSETPEAKPKQDDIQLILDTWKRLFPKKRQPKRATHSEKIRARLKDPAFRESWHAALEAAAVSPTLQRDSWFQFEFFVRNDFNWQRLLNEEWKWKDEQLAAQQARAAGRTPEAQRVVDPGTSVNMAERAQRLQTIYQRRATAAH